VRALAKGLEMGSVNVDAIRLVSLRLEELCDIDLSYIDSLVMRGPSKPVKEFLEC
jgi:hypothetical protein